MNKKTRIDRIKKQDLEIKAMLLNRSGKDLIQLFQSMIDLGLDKPPLNFLRSQATFPETNRSPICAKKHTDYLLDNTVRIDSDKDILKMLKRLKFPEKNIFVKEIDFYSKNIDRFLFLKTSFKKSNFGKSSIKNCLFHNCSFDDVDMEDTRIRKSFFFNCVFRKCYFRFTNIRNTKIDRNRFHSTRFYAINIIHSQITNSRFHNNLFENCVSKDNSFTNTKGIFTN